MKFLIPAKKKLLKHMYMKCFTENFGRCSAHLQKLQNKEKSDKCEINCRPSVLRSPTVLCAINTLPNFYSLFNSNCRTKNVIALSSSNSNSN